MYLQMKQCGICKQASFDTMFMLGELRSPIDGYMYSFCEECFKSLMLSREDTYELRPELANPTRIRKRCGT